MHTLIHDASRSRCILVLLVAMTCRFALGACWPPAPGGCAGPIHLHTKRYNVQETMVIGSITTKTTKGPWQINGARACGWHPCGSLPGLESLVFTYSEQREVCWNVNGAVTVEAKTGLIERLLLELGIAVEIGVQFTHCVTVTQTRQWSLSQSYCYHEKGRELVTEYSIKGHVLEHEAAFTWGCGVIHSDGTGHYEYFVTTCNTQRADGNAETFSVATQFAPRPAVCGGSIPDPDIYDGARSEPCCTNMTECGYVPPPGGHTCCGCWGVP